MQLNENMPIDNGPRFPHGPGIEVPPVTIAGPFVIGHVGYIHGPEGAPCPEYVPTRHEVEVLARHWAGVAAEIELFWAAFEQVGSDDTREQPYARARLSAAAKVLGAAAVRAVCDAEREREIGEYHPVVAEYLRGRGAGSRADAEGAESPAGAAAPARPAAGDDAALRAEAQRLAAALGGPWPGRVEQATGLPPVWLRAIVTDMRAVTGPVSAAGAG